MVRTEVQRARVTPKKNTVDKWQWCFEHIYLYKYSLFLLSHTTLLNKGYDYTNFMEKRQAKIWVTLEKKFFVNTEHQSHCFCRTLKVQNGKYYICTGLKNYIQYPSMLSNRFFVGELIGGGGCGGGEEGLPFALPAHVDFLCLQWKYACFLRSFQGK